jgi:hypothetical protein
MKLQLITALALATLVAAPAAVVTPASAGTLKNAWVRQETSIAHGLADGSLTPGEAVRLQHREDSIRNQAIFLKSTGGHLGPAERAYLGARLAVARGAIFVHRHN